jgi:hypothetical protein
VVLITLFPLKYIYKAKNRRISLGIITSIPYIKIIRTIEKNRQNNIEKTHNLYLCENKIIATSKEFSLKDVLDISYKTISLDYGFLYLHTTQGLFSYNVKTNPNYFIDEYKKLK